MFIGTKFGEIKGDMSDKAKEWARNYQADARIWFDRPPYQGTIAEVNTDKGVREERMDIDYAD